MLSTEGTSAEEKWARTQTANAIDERMGFARYESGPRKEGWLINMHSTTIEDETAVGGKAGVDFYFLCEDGSSFKAVVLYDPYFLIACKQGTEGEVEEWLRRKFEGLVKKMTRLTKEDLRMVSKPRVYWLYHANTKSGVAKPLAGLSAGIFEA